MAGLNYWVVPSRGLFGGLTDNPDDTPDVFDPIAPKGPIGDHVVG